MTVFPVLREGMKENFEDSFKWASKSAEQENAKANYRLGVLYRSGKGVKKDENKASEYFEKARDELIKLAEANDPRAQY